MQNFTTPMMKQYAEIKKQHQDCLLFFRLGDFYELFLEDAKIGAQVLDITLTGRPEGRDGRVPMAGVPYHAVDSYLSKLVKAGHKVAICEQITPPNKYGIAQREVVRIVTPGTVLDEKSLEQKQNNYLMCLLIIDNQVGLAFADLSTGQFQTYQPDNKALSQILIDEIARFNPTECILPPNLYNDPQILQLLKTHRQLNIYNFQQADLSISNATKFIKQHFSLTSLEPFGIEQLPIATVATAMLLAYLKETQKDKLGHLKKITHFNQSEYLMLDRSTVLNLELYTTIREHNKKGSLLNVLDQTVTAMGGRLLREWLIKPLTSAERISQRYQAINYFLNEHELRDTLVHYLNEVNDIERTISRLNVGIGNARDLISLKNSLQTITQIKAQISSTTPPLIQLIEKNIASALQSIIAKIDNTVVENPPFDLKVGNLIKTGIDPHLDKLRKQVHHGKDWISELEETERQKTGINTLKVRYNKVFGFYIEVSKSYTHLVPKHYLRKQTLVNGERFITPELKEQEEHILTAQEKINALEYQIYQSLLNEVLQETPIIQQTAHAIATLDCLINFTEIALKNNYQQPELSDSGQIYIKNGRHPVVETLLERNQFVPNDTHLDAKNCNLAIITGPNMAGKSVYIRQVALITLMAQIGSFVPAEQAKISLIDKLFVRSGASDVITSGLSTFMVEMVETAHILNHATQRSLIIMDEIGRGTSTYDGISIAWSVAEHLVNRPSNTPISLFATHYHELQNLAQQYPRKIKNFRMDVDNQQGTPTFLHTIVEGGSSHSYGVAVAQLAGIPESVITRAKEMLQQLEQQHTLSNHSQTKSAPQSELIANLQSIDISSITPLQALNLLASLKTKLEE